MLRSLVILGFTAVALLAAPGARAAEKPILLGAVYNLSGSQAPLDGPSARGAALAVAEANAHGGVLGRKVELVTADPASRLDEAARRTGALVDAHGSVSALLGLSDTDMVLRAAPVAAGRQLVFVTSGATSPRLPAQVPDFLYLACFGDNVQAAAAAEYAFNTLSARSVAILYNAATTYTTLLQSYFRTRFEQLGGTVLAVKSYRTLAEQAASVGSMGGADAVFLAAQQPAEAVAGVEKLRQGGIDVPILGGDGFDAASEWAKHPDLGGVYFTTHAYLGSDNDNPLVTAFVAAYRKANGGAAPDAFAALGYDAAGVLLAAIDAGGSAEPADVVDSLSRVENYQGVTGTISYTAGPVPQKSVTVLQVDGGKLRFVSQFVPAQVPDP